MRDAIFTCIILVLLPVCFRRPLIGLYSFSWLAYMRTQDLCWYWARNQRWSFLIAVVTILGYLSRPNKTLFIKCWRSYAMIALLAWVGLSVIMAPETTEAQLNAYVEFAKIIGVALFTTVVLTKPEHLRMLMWVIALSFGFYGVKVGVAGVLSGGNMQVKQGPGGMLEDNNNFALALCMALPLMLQLGQSERSKLLRRGVYLMIPLTVLTVIMTHSRGGFLTLVAVIGMLVWRSRNRVAGLAVAVAFVVVGVLVVPKTYIDRIRSIQSYEQDGSAMGRLAAWKTAINMSKGNPVFGVGLSLFQRNYMRYRSGEEHEGRRVAHNAYLQMLAECGAPALACYLFMIVATIWSLQRLRREALRLYNTSWIINYATMLETSMVAFVVGSTFLNRAEFDLFYHFIAIVLSFEAIARREMASYTRRDDGRARSGDLRVTRPRGFRRTVGPSLAGGLS
jgi:probable O-glycosylation ligase (exosortase A-associated)